MLASLTNVKLCLALVSEMFCTVYSLTLKCSTHNCEKCLPIVCVAGLTELMEEPALAYMKAAGSLEYAPMKAYDLPRSTVW